ncbi:MAG: hypothetical protein ROZ64_16605 [Burkholderiaceae bacterium]|nr:hypothetical protein [Burkholderiaceae bacterium]
MTDEQLDELMKRVAEGDDDAQQQIDTWIATALAPLCATPPLPDDVGWLNDESECCCSGEERVAA